MKNVLIYNEDGGGCLCENKKKVNISLLGIKCKSSDTIIRHETGLLLQTMSDRRLSGQSSSVYERKWDPVEQASLYCSHQDEPKKN